MRFQVAVAAFIACVIGGTALAQDVPFPDVDHRGKPTVIHGQGSASCGTFLVDRASPDRRNAGHVQEMAWVLGYLDGLQQPNPYNVASYDYGSLDMWLANYCEAHPSDFLMNAAQAFYTHIGGRGLFVTDYSAWRHFPGYTGR